MKTTRRAITLAAASTALAPRFAFSAAEPYALPMQGNARIIHQTDTHAQTHPVQFREPSQNIGIGAAKAHAPHFVGHAFLRHYQMQPGSRPAHAFTFLDFTKLAKQYGPMGGFAHLKTVIDQLRAEAGPGKSLLLDGGDLCQGSFVANETNGLSMVALGNLLGIDAMTGHWEFTYGQSGVEAIIKALRGKFLAQNVFLSAEAGMMGKPAFNANTGAVFEPYMISSLGAHQVGIIGQAFPYVPIAHPRRFVPDWRFGIHETNLQKMINQLRDIHKVDAVILLSHNGMEVDLKLASRVTGLDVILGGHTHDAVPRPVIVKNPGGRTIVTNAGTAGKFIAVLDLDLAKGRLRDAHYKLLPIYTDLIKPDPVVAAAITASEAPFTARLAEPLAKTDHLLYRRNNFYGSVDQMIMNASRAEMDAEIAFSPGFRWGNSFLPGASFTMGDLLSETAITYPMAYTQIMTGKAIKAMMEDVCDNLFNPNPYYQQGGDMIRVGGMNYACAPAKLIGHRISNMVLDNGQSIEANKSYKTVSWASVSLPQTGKPIWEVVATHLRHQKRIELDKPNQVKLLGITDNPGYES